MAEQFDHNCWSRVQAHLNQGQFTVLPNTQGRSIFSNQNNRIRILGRRHVGGANGNDFWFNVEDRQIASLQLAPSSFIAFACGAGANPDILLVPSAVINAHAPSFAVTPRTGFTQYNVRILRNGNAYDLAVPNAAQVALTQFLI